MEQPETIPVIAAVVRTGRRFLVGRRPVEKRHGGLWEFPGGKIAPGESSLEAARRELSEELSLSVTAVGKVLYSTRDENSPFEVHFIEVAASGVPIASEHSDVGWFTVEELLDMDLAPADARFLDQLKDGA